MTHDCETWAITRGHESKLVAQWGRDARYNKKGQEKKWLGKGTNWCN